MKPIDASNKSKEKEVYSNLRDDRVNQKPKHILGQLDRTSDIRSVFSKGDSTNYSYEVYTRTEVIDDTIPSYRSNYLPEKNNQNLLLPTELTLEQKKKVMKE